MVGLPDGEKIEDMCNRLDTIPTCDGRTDRHLATRHSPRYAYASRGKNSRWMCVCVCVNFLTVPVDFTLLKWRLSIYTVNAKGAVLFSS